MLVNSYFLYLVTTFLSNKLFINNFVTFRLNLVLLNLKRQHSSDSRLIIFTIMSYNRSHITLFMREYVDDPYV